MNTALHHTPDVRSMRRTSAILVALAALLALGVLLLWLLRQPVFDIRRIVIEGDVEHTTPAQLRRQLTNIAQAGWFTLDLQQARAAFEQLPWVRRAQVRRAFPQHLRVTLHEHQAAAWWRGEGELVSRQGEVFEATFARLWRDAQDGAEGRLPAALARLPQLSGPEGSAAQVLDMYRQLTPALAPLGLELRALRLNALVQDGGVPGRDYVRNKSTGLAPSLALGLGTPTRVFGDAAIVRHDNRPDGGVPTIGLPGYYNAALDGAGLATQTRGPVNSSNYYGALDDFHKSEQDQFTVRVEHDLAQGSTLRNTTRVGRNKVDQLVTSPGNIVSDNTPNPNPPPTNIAIPRQPGDWETSRGRHLRWQENKLITNQTHLSLNLDTGGIRHSISTGLELIVEKQTSKGRLGQGTHGTSPVNGAANRTNPWQPNVQEPITGRNLQFSGQQTEGETKTVGLYAFDTLELNPRWQVSGGVRVERFNTTTHSITAPDANGVQTRTHLKAKDTLYSGKLALVFKPVEEGTLYAGISTAQQPPGGANFTLSANAANINNPNMDPSKATNVEAGAKWEILDKRLLLTGALFQTTVRNDLGTTDAATGEITQYGKKEVKGLELGAVGQITPAWNISAGFARMTTKVKEGTAAQTGATLNWSPKKSFTAWTTYRLGNGLTIGGGARYMDSVARQVNAANQANPGAANMLYTPDYWVWDGYIAYAVKQNISVQLNLYNLADKHYFANLNNSGNRYTPGGKRSALLTASVRF